MKPAARSARRCASRWGWRWTRCRTCRPTTGCRRASATWSPTPQREKLAENRPDPLLRESAAILADAVRLLNNDRQLSAQVLKRVDTPGHWAD